MVDGEIAPFGALLRSLRLASGISQEDLADRANLSVDTVSALERGVNSAPHRDTVSRLATALGAATHKRSELEASAARSRRRGIRTVVPTAPANESFRVESPSNLPSPVGALVGRHAIVAELTELVERQRLVTLVGSGGIGKTRVALEVGRRVLSRFADGVWIVDFSSLSDSRLLPDKVAAEIGVRGAGDDPATDVLVTSLRRRHALLIFDTCEHVIDDAARLAQSLLHAAPGLHILATSRETLRVSAETVFTVPPLTYPDRAQCVSTADAQDFGAIALFAQRAQALDRQFDLSEETVPLVAEICRRVEGISLGIEIAASQMRTLSLADLVHHLERRLPTLTRGSRSGPAHHQTMRTLIEWSYRLLSEDERTLLNRVAIFADGWALEAAQAVCATAPLDAQQFFGALTGLVEKSQVLLDRHTFVTRYRLLESIRAYGLERLEQSGESYGTAHRHAQWAVDFAEASAERLWSVPLQQWLSSVKPELENMRAALRWAFGEGESPKLAGRIAAGLGSLWLRAGLTNEGRQAMESALVAISSSIDEDRELSATIRGALTLFVDGSERAAVARQAIEYFHSQGDLRQLAVNYYRLGIALYWAGDPAAADEVSGRATELLRDCGSERSLYYALALGFRAKSLAALGRLSEARLVLAEEIALLHSLGDEYSAFLEKINIVDFEFTLGNREVAVQIVSDVIDEFRIRSHDPTLGVDPYTLSAYLNLTAYRIILGQADLALSEAREALKLARHSQSRILVAIAVQNAAAIAAHNRDAEGAARLKAFADHTYLAQGGQREPTEQRVAVLIDELLAATSNKADLERMAAQGAHLDEDQALDLAISVVPGPEPPTKESISSETRHE